MIAEYSPVRLLAQPSCALWIVYWLGVYTTTLDLVFKFISEMLASKDCYVDIAIIKQALPFFWSSDLQIINTTHQ